LKAARERCHVTYKRKLIRVTTDFSTKAPKARKAWNIAIQVLKENNCQLRLLYLAKLSFIIER
jgi:hypothetical protein